ncbi:MAG: GntR family transcriptional regulator [Alphaproteobacteria bacterium]|nr:GntR family transcriptional regulator [Alphaproteobacteria bacterium]
MLDHLQTGPALIDQVHDQLVEAIASGDLAPGQRLTQESVAAMLGVSRQPVSHALQILKRRGLLIEHGRRGLAVAPLERDRITNLYQVRAMLDGLAARLAAEHCRNGTAPRGDIDALEQALHAGLALCSDAETKELVSADVAFHAALHRLSGNPEIARTIAEQWPQFMRSMGFVLASRDRYAVIWSEHRAIAESILAGQPEAAEQRARAHAHGAANKAAAELPESCSPAAEAAE